MFRYSKKKIIRQITTLSFIIVILLLFYKNVNFIFLESLDFTVVYEYKFVLFDALLVTLYLSFMGIIIGTILGIILAIIHNLSNNYILIPIRVYIEIFRNTPLLVQLLWIHFALPTITGISTNALTSGLIGLALQSSAYLAEIIRAGIQSVDKGQFEASYSLNIPKYIHWIKVILPQAFKLINFIVFPYGPNNNFLFLKCLVYFSFNELLVIMYPFFDNKFENKLSLAFK